LIGTSLANEFAALCQFRQILLVEQEILKNNQADKLQPVVDQKSALAGRLGSILAERERLLTNGGFGTGRPGMDAWIKSIANDTVASSMRSQWQNLLTLAEETRALHDVNGKLIALHLQSTQQALTALLSAAGRPLTYGPDGQQRIGSGSGRTLGSA
jgi:flagella synthesis protein FlgN